MSSDSVNTAGNANPGETPEEQARAAGFVTDGNRQPIERAGGKPVELKEWGSGPHEDGERVIVASLFSGEKFVETAGEWAAMKLPERTFRIIQWAIQTVRRHGNKNHFTGKVKDERILAAIETAWELLPRHEREIIEAMGVSFETCELEAGTAGAASSVRYGRAVGGYQPPVIRIDPGKVHSTDDAIHLVLHELVHVAFRHADIEMFFPSPKLSWLFEWQANATARALMNGEPWPVWSEPGEPEPEP